MSSTLADYTSFMHWLQLRLDNLPKPQADPLAWDIFLWGIPQVHDMLHYVGILQLSWLKVNTSW